MKTIEIELPQTHRFSDYHEGDFLIEDLRNVGIRGLRIIEVGFAGEYIFMLYDGNRKDKKNKELLNKLQREVKKWENDHYGY